MEVTAPPASRRRRPRRGSLARPVNAGLYRASFLVVGLPLLVLAFTISTPRPLPKPALPGAFDTSSAAVLATGLANGYPDRAPGSAGAAGAADWVVRQLRPYGLRTTRSVWSQRVAGLGVVPLENITTVVPGQSSQVIVVMAHRDDIGTGPGANDNASGTATLIELARAYAQPPGQAPVQSTRTIVFLSTDGGAFGGLGALHFARTSPYRRRIVAVVNLDAVGGAGVPSIEIAGDRPRSPSATLVATTIARIAEQTGAPPHHVGFLGQLIDLAFPFTLYEQGPFVARGIPAITITTGGDRPPGAFGDTASALNTPTLARLGLAAQQLLGSLDEGFALAPETGSYVWLGGRVVSGWAIELVLVALLTPFVVAIVDLYALCRRHRVPIGPAVAALRSRLGFWLFAGAVFTCFRLLGAWPAGPPRPLDPATAPAGAWPVTALLALLLVLATGWALVRPRLAPRRPVEPEEHLAGSVVALTALLVVALLVVATNPFALLFLLPALHIWLWLPQIRIARAPVRLALFAAGLCGPALLLASLAWRFGLGFDAVWYLLALAAVGYVKTPTLAIALVATAATAQLAMAAAGRYSPCPTTREPGPRGPIRELVRLLVLGGRPRRHTEPARNAVHGYRSR